MPCVALPSVSLCSTPVGLPWLPLDGLQQNVDDMPLIIGMYPDLSLEHDLVAYYFSNILYVRFAVDMHQAPT